MRAQYLDSMDLERERGITIKAQNVRVDWHGHTFHLIDTPGHVDFGYEVSRSLAACEGVVLVVDAAQGIEAQTLANCYLALEHDLEIVAALNKIDLPAADPDRYAAGDRERARHRRRGHPADLGQDRRGRPRAARRDRRAHPAADRRPRRAAAGADLRQPVRPVPRRRVERAGDERPARAPGRGCAFMQAGAAARARSRSACAARCRRRWPSSARARSATSSPASRTSARPAPARRSPPSTHGSTRAAAGLPRPEADGVLRAVPDRRRRLREPARSLEKLKLNDASISYTPESSGALGFGFRCGFLGLLHMEIVKERLEREFDLALIATAPSVEYRVHRTDGDGRRVDNPADLPDPQKHRLHRGAVLQGLDHHAEATTPGTLMELCQHRRGELTKIEYLSPERVELHYRIPLAEVVVDFFDQMKSRTQGYASLDYELAGYRRVQPRQGRPAAQRRAGRRLLHDRAPRQGRSTTAGG